MSTSSTFSYLLQSLIVSGPTVVVAAVGLVLILVNWQKLGRAALLAAGGLGLHLLASLSYPVASALLMGMANAGSGTTMATNFRFLGVFNGILHAIALALLLAAILTPQAPKE